MYVFVDVWIVKAYTERVQTSLRARAGRVRCACGAAAKTSCGEDVGVHIYWYPVGSRSSQANEKIKD